MKNVILLLLCSMSIIACTEVNEPPIQLEVQLADGKIVLVEPNTDDAGNYINSLSMFQLEAGDTVVINEIYTMYVSDATFDSNLKRTFYGRYVGQIPEPYNAVDSGSFVYTYDSYYYWGILIAKIVK